MKSGVEVLVDLRAQRRRETEIYRRRVRVEETAEQRRV